MKRWASIYMVLIAVFMFFASLVYGVQLIAEMIP